MLYRVSLTGKYNRFSVPQLGYLGYRYWLSTDLTALRQQLPRLLVAAPKFASLSGLWKGCPSSASNQAITSYKPAYQEEFAPVGK